MIKINNVEIAVYPAFFQPSILDLDDSETSVRSANGTLNRDRIAVKRKIEMSWGVLKWSECAAILQAVSGTSFTVYYPDPQTGQHETKTFYVSDRTAPFSNAQGSDMLWNGLKFTLTEV